MHTKSGRSFLGGPEKYLVKRFTKYVPLETYHLTLLTLVWSALVLVAGYLAQKNIDWLWLTVAAIVLQYITDLFDGAVGRYRKTGLVKWGFYMDHYLDYVFLACFVASFGFLLPNIHMLALTVILAAGFMISTFLDFGATQEFSIYHFGFGPTEIRIVFIAATILVWWKGAVLLAQVLPWFNLFMAVLLVSLVYRTQKQLWKQDMRNR
jgi:phosphatidylglycerophosphate synthase